MSKYGKFLLDLKVWSDNSSTTNDPKQRDFSWIEFLSGVEFTGTSNSSHSIAANGSLTYQMPIATAKFIFIKTDQSLIIKYNNDDTVLNQINPTSNSADGILFQKINFTSLTITNTSDDIANLVIFVGG